MPKIHCPVCDRKVRTNAARRCPKCGLIIAEHIPSDAPPAFGAPRIVSGQDESSPFVVVEGGVFSDGVITVMDREQFEFLYGNSAKPDPRQRDLDDLLPNVTRVRAIASAMFRGAAMGTEVIVDTEDAEALAEFRKALRIVDDSRVFDHCACLGGPTLELYAGTESAATIGLQHGHSIRWSRWKPDAPLRDGQLLTDWLLKHGFEPTFLDCIYHNGYDAGGMGQVGYRRPGSNPLSRTEQQMRLVEIKRARGGDPAEVLAECQALMEADPEMTLGYAVRSQIWSQQGRYDLCMADCTEGLRLGLRDPDLFYLRAVAKDHLGHTEEALADCDAALELDPDHLNALNSRSVIHLRLGNTDAATADLDQVIGKAPDWAMPYLNRGNLHLNRNNLDAAIADYDRVIDRLGESADEEDRRVVAGAYWNRGQCHRLKGNNECAEADALQARARNSKIGTEGSGLA